MDEFGVLVESIGFKAHGKSAPMAKPKPKPKAHAAASTTSFDDSSSLPVDELDGIFRSSSNVDKTRQSQNWLGGDDIFGGGQVSGSSQYGGIDFESVLNSSSNKMDAVDLNSVGGNDYGGLMRSRPRQSDSVDDLLGVFGLDSGGEGEDKGSEFDELIPGFGGASPTITGVKSKTVLPPGSNGRQSNSSSPLGDDPFSVFQSSASRPDASRPFDGPSERDTSKESIKSSFDEFDDFVMGKAHNDSRTDEKRNKDSNAFENVDDFDAIFGGGTPQKHGAPTSINQDFQFDIFSGENRRPESKQTSSGSSTSKTQTSSATTMGDNFTALFGDISTSSGEFQEIEGEPEDRRRARLNRHMRTNARVAEALAEKNQRDLQSQQEQDEKHRLAETLDHDIRRWAAGKEGNLRALLSSLQQVLWPECGWRPVSLTDMITSDSVKKVYKKATLYVHPDKVQQKGATLTQKYIAEKVFDLLKEAWNKFSAEELR